MAPSLLLLLASVVFAAASGSSPHEGSFPLSIVHLNDFHARFLQVAPCGGVCPTDDPSSCVGGIARVVTAANTLVNERPNALLLNAGDNFQGTLWFSVHDWNVTATFLNLLQWDAVTLGNHEFDLALEPAIEFIKGLNAPVVVANIDDSKEPSFQGIYEKSIVLVRGGRQIGIIGVITDTTESISSPGDLEFRDVAETAAEEGKKLKDAGVDIIVLLSHAGIEVDLEVAESDPYVDIIVGSHSHTLLFNGEVPGVESAFAEYPIIVKRKDNIRKVAIVQAGSYSRYLGNLSTVFDEEGELLLAEGNPIYLDGSITPDAASEAALDLWADAVERLQREQGKQQQQQQQQQQLKQEL